jgi:hypothetical protein
MTDAETVQRPSASPPAKPFYSTPPLRIARLLFELLPTASLHLPLETRGNVLRGAFGTVFQRTVCNPGCPGTATCPNRATCAFAMLFEPGWRVQSGETNGTDAPRGFLFRPTQHPDPDFGPDQPFHFELRLFGQAIEVVPFFIRAFQALARQGLHGTPVHLSAVQTLDWADASRGELVSAGKVTRNQPLVLRLGDLRLPPLPKGPIRIDFLTPTWLRHDDKDQRIPTLEALVCRLRDRISSLSLLYEDREWQADYGAMGQLASKAEIDFCHGGWRQDKRRSSRTGQVMPLAGFLGTILYDKVHPALWRLLNMGQELHVGRHTVWGNGAYRLVLDE